MLGSKIAHRESRQSACVGQQTASCMSNPFCSRKKQEGVQFRKLGAADAFAIIAINILVSF